MSEAAYGKRNYLKITLRKLFYFIFRIYKSFFSFFFLKQQNDIKRISTFPIISDYSQLYDILNRLSWSIPYKKGIKIFVQVDRSINVDNLNYDPKIKGQRLYIKKSNKHIILTHKKIINSDLFLCINYKSIQLFNPFYVAKSDIFDKRFYLLTESYLSQKLFNNCHSIIENQNLYNTSLKNFVKLTSEFKDFKDSYCFVTGPSFDSYKSLKFKKNSVKVICNSIVKNTSFLSYINGPDILVFADPVFHFGPSEYSAKFRDAVVEVYRKYKPYIIVPYYCEALLLSHYPQFREKLIGMRIMKSSINFPNKNKFYVNASGNILTLFMLTLASSISNNIFILGADGRNPNENYFWKHSNAVQFEGLMDSVFKTHPSFFRDRSYEDYYKSHCKYLENLIEFGEEQGKKYLSLNKSYIAALNNRFYKNV